jgi:hypothetical protein
MDDNSIPNSSLKEAYTLLSASTPSGLVKRFIEEDQKCLKSGTWDYKNPDLVINKVKDLVEFAIAKGPLFTEVEENDDLRDLLWFWYHHAIGLAIWKYKDKKAAEFFSEKACHYQIPDNPNKISKLLYLLVRAREVDAKAWFREITTEPDKSAATAIMQEYERETFFT